jgi:hypothetical protein
MALNELATKLPLESRKPALDGGLAPAQALAAAIVLPVRATARK